MAIGARDKIDKLLVKKYSEKQVDNHNYETSMISADDVMKMMSEISTTNLTQIQLSRRLSVACYGINAASARYKSSRRFA